MEAYNRNYYDSVVQDMISTSSTILSTVKFVGQPRGLVKGTGPLSILFSIPNGVRFLLWWFGLVGLLLGFLLVAPFALLQRLKVPQSSDYRGTSLEGAAVDFILTNQTGSVVSLSGLRGQVITLTFLDSQC